MKKMFIFTTILALALGITACGGKLENTEKPVKEDTPPETTTPLSETKATPGTRPAPEPEPEPDEEDLPPEIDPDRPVIALTFDDGPNTTVSVQILDSLEARGIPVTYFLIGQNINNNSAEVMRRAYELGCEFGNHSWGYNSMGDMEPEAIIKSLNDTSDKIVEVLGEDARPKYFRAPNLNKSKEMTETIKSLGYPYMEGILGNDWENITPEDIYNLIVPRVSDGTIILLHDGGSNQRTADAIDDILDELIEQGYQFVTLSKLFEIKGVTPEPGVVYNKVG